MSRPHPWSPWFRSPTRTALPLLLMAAAAVVRADEPYLVADIDTTGEPYAEPCILTLCPPPTFHFGSNLSHFTPLGDTLFFVADDRTHGAELWASRGTPESTQLVAETVPGATGSQPIPLGIAGDRVVVWADTNGPYLYSMTQELTSTTAIDPDCAGCSLASPVAEFDDHVIYQVYAPERQHYVLFRSDGFSAHEVDDLCDRAGFCIDRVYESRVWQSSLYYDRWFPGHARTVLRLDEASAEPVPVPTTCTWSQDLVARGDHLYFVGTCYEPENDLHRNGLYRAASPEAEPEIVWTFLTYPAGSTAQEPLPRELTPFATDQAGFVIGNTLWTTDGTAAGTRPATGFDEIGGLIGLGHRLLVHGVRQGIRGLWSIEETGEVEVLTLNPLTRTPQPVPTDPPLALFSANEAAYGTEAWVTDGTPSGTYRLGDVHPGTSSSDPGVGGLQDTGFAKAGDRVYFGADDGVHDVELWAWQIDVQSTPTPCSANHETLCLGNDRFRATVEWEDFEGEQGTGTAIPFSSESGAFWFFEDVRYELVVKIVDGRGHNGHFWVFHGSLTNVRYTLTVTDTETGAEWVRTNPLGSFGSDGDTFAFPGSLP